MGSPVDPLGKLLSRCGVLDADAVNDVLDRQRRALPFASCCYVLGYADEESLVRQLSRQRGVPGVVLDKSIVRVKLCGGAARDLLLSHNVVCIDEDETHLYVAAENPQEMRSVFQELEFMKGKTVVPHVALQITVARTLRASLRALGSGLEMLCGSLVSESVAGPFMFVVTEVEPIAEETPAALAHNALFSDVTSDVRNDDLVLIDTIDGGVAPVVAQDRLGEGTSQGPAAPGGAGVSPTNEGGAPDLPGAAPDLPGAAPGDHPTQLETRPSGAVPFELLNLDHVDESSEGGDPTRVEEQQRGGKAFVLIVDDDLKNQQNLAECLHDDDFMVSTATNCLDAIEIIRSTPPDAAVVDVMLPEVSGFQICRSIKQSRRYGHIPVVLMSAVIDSGRVTEDVLQQHGADGYFEKPVSPDRVRDRLRELLAERLAGAGSPADDGFSRALELYRAGDMDEAVAALRQDLETDPRSAKHHFVLANLLQKQSMIYEAIDEYEATVDLKPNYFPALTRLAYLYYKQGFAAKAIETWRKALPHCPDPGLRENIEVFMRKLIADMASEVSG